MGRRNPKSRNRGKRQGEQAEGIGKRNRPTSCNTNNAGDKGDRVRDVESMKGDL